MRHRFAISGFAGLVALAFTFSIAGCTPDDDYESYSEAATSEGHGQAPGHGHHPAHPPAHGGHVIELDDVHAHHAELVFDKESRDITLYFYGAEVGEAKPATDVVFELDADGEETALEVQPSPLEGETDETSSRYVIAGSQLPDDITSEEQLEAHFHATMDGEEYVGELQPHSHDHGDHDHHDEDDHDDEHHEDEHTDEGDSSSADPPEGSDS